MPEEKALFFPILNIECSQLERVCVRLRRDRAGVAQHCGCSDLPKDDVLTFIGEGPFSPGTYCPAVDDGYYLMLAPLPDGPHTLHFHGEIPSFGFTIDVTYNLTVSDQPSCSPRQRGLDGGP